MPSTIGRSHLSFCAGVPREREQVHVAVVGRLAVERHRTEDRAVGLLVHRRPADDRQRHAAVVLRRLRRPQALRPWLSPARCAARRGGCSRGRRSCRGSASSGSTCSSTKRRVRRRMSSISGGRVKSMVGLSTLRHRIRSAYCPSPCEPAVTAPARQEQRRWPISLRISAAIGGALIGLAAVLLMLLTGRIAGISGIFGGCLDFGTGDKRLAPCLHRRADPGAAHRPAWPASRFPCPRCRRAGS